MSNRIIDTRGEKALGIFLDKYFYPDFIKLEGFSKFERVYDVSSQKLGSDIKLTNSSGKIINIDEKAQLHYINNPRDTFAFEVSYISDKGDVLDGWLISKDNITDCYLLAWIKEARTDKLNRIVSEDYLNVEISFITKKQILNYLSSLKYSIAKISKEASLLREDGSKNRVEISSDCFLYHSKIEYTEDPINIVISKSVLENLAYANYNISKDEIIKKECKK